MGPNHGNFRDTLLLGGNPIPVVYVSDAQVNVLVPFETQLNKQLSLLVVRGSAISVPVQVAVFDAQPAILATAGNEVEVAFPLELPFLRLRTVDGLPTMIAAFTTDIPKLTNWGEPLLIGPGSIHVAHTDGEYIEKQQLHDAIDLYGTIAKKLVS